MRTRDFLLVVLVLGMATACVARPETPIGDAWVGELVSYLKAVSPEHGTVGYVKVFEYAQEGFGEPFRLYHVYDLDFAERGILNEIGTGNKIVRLPTDVARLKGRTTEEVPLDAQPLPFNVARCLDLDPAIELKLTPATPADVTRGEE